ncbi:hypothetical protein, partial [Salmonella enterica]|uniref:hypothetical protein n=1 Tax=Salmonella enterica TaxID=28901 RepID=UPI0011BDBEAF
MYSKKQSWKGCPKRGLYDTMLLESAVLLDVCSQVPFKQITHIAVYLKNDVVTTLALGSLIPNDYIPITHTLKYMNTYNKFPWGTPIDSTTNYKLALLDHITPCLVTGLLHQVTNKFNVEFELHDIYVGPAGLMIIPSVINPGIDITSFKNLIAAMITRITAFTSTGNVRLISKNLPRLYQLISILDGDNVIQGVKNLPGELSVHLKQWPRDIDNKFIDPIIKNIETNTDVHADLLMSKYTSSCDVCN